MYNHTSMTVEQVRALPHLGTYRNEWRKRTVELYRLAEGHVVSIGTAFDNSLVVVAEETDCDHDRALNAFKYNRTYVAR